MGSEMETASTRKKSVNRSLVLMGVFAFIGFCVKLSVVFSENFVNAYLIRSFDDINDNHLIGGVGVYKAFYDPTSADVEIVRESGIPIDPLTTKSAEFPLLFPAQSNFVAFTLPISSDFALEVDTLFADEDIGPIFPSIESAAALIEDFEFNSCGDYLNTTLDNLPTYFTTYQQDTLPKFLSVLLNQVAIEAGVDTVDRDLLLPTFLGVFLSRQFCGTLLNIDNDLLPSIRCTFIEFLDGLSKAIQASSTVDDRFSLKVDHVNLFYSGCIEAQLDALEGIEILVSTICPAAFAQQFLATAMSSAFLIDQDTLADPTFLLENLTSECELDAIDNSKMNTAQGLYASAVFFATIALGCVVGLAISHRKEAAYSTKKITASVIFFTSFISGLLGILSLTTIRSAPVYDLVGLEPNGVDLEPIFLETVVPYLGASAGFLYFLVSVSSISYIVSLESDDLANTDSKVNDVTSSIATDIRNNI